MTTTPPRNRDADRAQAEQLIARLGELSRQVAETAGEPATDEITADLRETSAQLAFAADLLGAYAAGLALATPDPLTNAFLVDRFDANVTLPDNDATVLIWSESDEDNPWLGWFDGQTWWYCDGAQARKVRHWAHRPGVGQ